MTGLIYFLIALFFIEFNVVLMIDETLFMPDYVFWILYLIVLFILQLVYFRIAERFRILDYPNNRSSHNHVTLRGGGIIVPISLFIWYLLHLKYGVFFTGLFLISFISFLDDLKSLSSRLRALIQIVSASLLIWQLQLGLPLIVYPVLVILIVGVVNACNFMDGINGITGSYSLLAACTLLFINVQNVQFVESELLMAFIGALLVFNFFNFRKSAVCFAGDVGSISIAFVLCFLIAKLVLVSGSCLFLLLILLFGLDASSTILFRILRSENIIQPHRSHFYQILVHKNKWTHLQVSGMYFFIQLFINIIVLLLANADSGIISDAGVLLLIVIVFVFFLALRLKIEGIKVISPAS